MTNIDERDGVALTLREIARRLHVSERTAWTWAKRGMLPCVKIGKSLRFPLKLVEQWLEQLARGGGVATRDGNSEQQGDL